MAPLYVRSAPPPHRPAGNTKRKQLPAGISLCMIVKDEERFLRAALESVAGCVDEICIVDTGSTDGTLAIAEEFGARIEHRTWCDDFAWARNEVLRMATKRWIFVLDADEELDAESQDELKCLRTAPADLMGMWVRCRNLCDDYKGTGLASHAIVRIFPNHPRLRYVSPVHEFVSLDGKSTGIEARMGSISITHHGYLSEIVKSRNKAQRNLALVRAATERDPQEPFNWYNLGTTTFLNGDMDAAIDAFEHMRALIGDEKRGYVPNALAQLAEIYTDHRGDYEGAIVLAQESLAKAPHFANAHFALGRAHVHAKRFAEGRAAFEAAIADLTFTSQQFIVDDEVSVWKAHSEIGSSYGNEGDNVMALKWFDSGLEKRPNVIPLRVNRARALERLGRYSDARDAFHEIATDEAGDVHSVDFLNFLLRHDDFATALVTIEEILPSLSPRTQATVLVMAARVASHTGAADPETFLVRAQAAFPGAADALDALESLYASRGDGQAVMKLRADELSAPLSLAVDFVRRGARHLSDGHLGDAEAVTRQGLVLAPNDPALHYNLAAVFTQTDRKEAALAELDAAGTLGDVGLRATFLKAIVLGDLRRFTEAIVTVDAVIALAPTEADARIRRFQYCDALSQDAQSEATLRAALALNDPRIAVELATWLMGKGRYAEARSVADSALKPAVVAAD
jgi:tetratricopeptide (TPR) repeat protein